MHILVISTSELGTLPEPLRSVAMELRPFVDLQRVVDRGTEAALARLYANAQAHKRAAEELRETLRTGEGE